MNTFMCCKKYKNVLRDVATLGVQLQGGGEEGRGLNWAVSFHLIFKKGSEANIGAVTICHVWVVGM